MQLDIADIRKLKLELRRDLEAVERTEALVLARQRPNGSAASVVPSTHDEEAKPSMLALIIEALRPDKRLRPKEIVAAVGLVHPFESVRKGMSSITSVLTRQKGKTIEKLSDGRYMLKKGV